MSFKLILFLLLYLLPMTLGLLFFAYYFMWPDRRMKYDEIKKMRTHDEKIDEWILILGVILIPVANFMPPYIIICQLTAEWDRRQAKQKEYDLANQPNE